MSQAPNGSPDSVLDPVQIVAHAPVGSVVYGFAEEEPGIWHTDFIIRERTDVLYQMMLEPRLEVKAGAVESNGVALVLVLFTFNPKLAVYLTWWNLHAPVTGPDDLHPFEAMVRDEPIHFWFVGDGETCDYQLQSRHPLQPFFREMRSQLGQLPPWSPGDFAREKADLLTDLPDPMLLWKQME